MSQYRKPNKDHPTGAGYGMGTRSSVPSRTSVPPRHSNAAGPGSAGTQNNRSSAPTAYSYGGSRSYANMRQPARKKNGWIVWTAAVLVIALIVAGVLLAMTRQPDQPEPLVQAVVQATDESAPTAAPVETPVPQVTEMHAPTATPTARSAETLQLEPQSRLYRYYDPSLRWYMQQLTDHEKSLFVILYDGIADAKTTITPPQMRYSKEELERVITVLQRDCPELVHFDHEASVSYTTTGDYVHAVTVPYTYEEDSDNLNVSEHIMTEIMMLLTEEERAADMAQREHSLYRKIVERAVYDMDFEHCANADAVFAYGRAKCSGFASAFDLACRYYGIPSIYVVGEGRNSEGTKPHAWNYVQINGEWYICDPTWDRAVYESFQQQPEPIASILNYFNMTNAEARDSHIPEADYATEGWKLPECTATSASFWNMFHIGTEVTADDWRQVLIQQLNEAVRGQRQEIILRVKDAEDYAALAEAYLDCVDEWIQTTDNWGAYRSVSSESCGLLILYNFAWTEENPYQQSNLQVRFFDVGDADAALVSCEGHILLIDGGTEKSGSSQLYSFLENNGISYVDAVIVSHPHSDHAGGLCGALSYEKCEFGTLYSPVKSSDNKSFQTLLEKAAQRGLQPVIPDVGMQFRLGSAVVTFLSPEANKSYENVNNKSLVVRIDYGDTSFLFTGDAMENAEADLLKSGLNLDVDVLKVAHHGADSSSGQAFLNAASPEVAIVSCGADNKDHPGAETLARLQKMGTLILRTDQSGQIVVFSDGQYLTYATEK